MLLLLTTNSLGITYKVFNRTTGNVTISPYVEEFINGTGASFILSKFTPSAFTSDNCGSWWSV